MTPRCWVGKGQGFRFQVRIAELPKQVLRPASEECKDIALEAPDTFAELLLPLPLGTRPISEHLSAHQPVKVRNEDCKNPS
jgi:hypothetical protein